MANEFPSVTGTELFRQIKSHIGEADRLCGTLDYMNGDPADEDVEHIEVNLEAAFEESLFLMERLQLPQTRQRIQDAYEKARKNLSETKFSVNMGEPYLIWSYRLSQLLSAVKYLESGTAPNSLETVRQICDGFHRSALKLQAQRYANRPGLQIDDEYDVQYLMEALLVGPFADVRREEHTPSIGGGSARMDFLLKEESIVVETKMMRASLSDRLLADELIQDKARYRAHPDCKILICFAYDPAHLLRNPNGLEADLSEDEEDFIVQVWVRPKA